MTSPNRVARVASPLARLVSALGAYVLAALLVVGLLGVALTARADAPPAGVTPRDMPALPQGVKVTIPVTPASYEHRDLGWLKVVYTPNAGERVKPLLEGANAFRDELAKALGQPVLPHLEVRIARTPEEMASLAPPEAPPPPYAVGVAYSELDLVLLTLIEPRTSAGTDLDAVFRHELVHIALNDAVAGHHVPVWFNEGLAMQLAGENTLERQKTLWDARLSGTILELNQLDRSFPAEAYEVGIAYAQSADFVRFLYRQADRARFAALIQRVHDGQPFEGALANAYGTDLRKLEYQWRAEVDRKFNYLPVIMGGSLLWAALFGVMVAAYVKRRRRSQATLARWGREEAALDAAIERARAAEHAADIELPDAALVRASAQIARGASEAHGRESVAKVEHDGHWHTLH